MLAFNQTLSNRPQLVFGEWRSYMGWGFSLRGSSPGRSGGGREKEGELAITFLNLNSTSNSHVAPSRLSCQISANQREAETSANVLFYGRRGEASENRYIYYYVTENKASSSY